ncbi:MAG: histidine kinase dimerization/phospho-acceptor domain-containing protein [Acidobacteriota bacterium]
MTRSMGPAGLRLARDGTITSWNEAASHLWGSELAGRKIEDLLPDVRGALKEAMSLEAPSQVFCIAPAGARSGQAMALVCRRAGRLEWEVELLPLQGGAGREAALLSALLHDLRTPLTTLLGASELLHSGELSSAPERTGTILKVAAGAARQIADLVNTASERHVIPGARKGE